MLYAIKYYESNSYRELLINVLSEQHEALSIEAPKDSYWSRFDTEYLENLMVKFSNVIKQ